MRAGALARRPARAGVRAAPAARLHFLRGSDADAQLWELCAGRGAALPVLGALARAVVERKLHEELGHRSVADWSRERLGIGARTVFDWARVWSRLQRLPLLREAVCAGDISFSVARLVVSVVTPETQASCLADVRGRTMRAVEAMVRAARQAEKEQPLDPVSATDEDEARVHVRIGCSGRTSGMWHAAVELARRVAGEALPLWACAEWVAAEAASAIGAAEDAPDAREPAPPSRPPCSAPETQGLRDAMWPRLRWQAVRRALPAKLAACAERLDACHAHEVDRRFRAAIAFLQARDLEIGRILRQVLERRLYRGLGFDTFDHYVRERLDLAPRTARRLVALARTEHRAPALATAFQRGRITAFQATAIARGTAAEAPRGEDPTWARARARRWIAHARRISLRRLEDEVEIRSRGEIGFLAPRAVADAFLAMVRRVGLERLLAHAIRTWVRQGEQFEDYADFERDGYRCTAPGCTARRGLESHHIWFRSAGGPDVPWNRTTLCQFHHHHAVHGPHAGRVRIRGHAPDGLIYHYRYPCHCAAAAAAASLAAQVASAGVRET